MISRSLKTLHGLPPIIIAHRGASGIMPEHTLEGYDLAIQQGADFIEPDLVITRDGHLVARHDRYLSETTNVSDLPEFASYQTEKLDCRKADWFVEDFTLSEIRTLRARQPRRHRPLHYDDQFKIPTFAEVLQLAKRRTEELGRPIGVYPETKHPAAFEALGLSFDKALAGTLNAHGFSTKTDPVFIQSFEIGILRRLRKCTPLRLIYLFSKIPSESMHEIACFADGIGPSKTLLSTPELASSGLIESAHAANLEVHPWTFRDDALDERFPDIKAEIRHYFDLGIDGGFFDFPETGVSVRDEA